MEPGPRAPPTDPATTPLPGPPVMTSAGARATGSSNKGAAQQLRERMLAGAKRAPAGELHRHCVSMS